MADKDTYEARVLLRRFIDEFQSLIGNAYEDWSREQSSLPVIEEIYQRILTSRDL
ncbi:MAG: hypothetical protein GF411_08035 [Candidatus Lokiarchaeota archaeon]|nr:hypothetical protein [Candidatus Lokiarchaeota archaeon]